MTLRVGKILLHFPSKAHVFGFLIMVSRIDKNDFLPSILRKRKYDQTRSFASFQSLFSENSVVHLYSVRISLQAHSIRSRLRSIDRNSRASWKAFFERCFLSLCGRSAISGIGNFFSFFDSFLFFLLYDESMTCFSHLRIAFTICLIVSARSGACVATS